jgi:hypothetical protein
MNLLQLLVGMIDRPRSTLTYIRDHPKRIWLLPIGLCAIGAVVYGVVAAPLMVQLQIRATQEMLASMPLETAQQMEQYIQEPTVNSMLLTGVGFGVLGVVLGWLVWAGGLHLLAALFGGERHLPAMMGVMAWAWLPFFLRPLALTGYVLWAGELLTNPGVSALVASGNTLADAANPLWVLLAAVDPFLVWNLILVIIGVAVVSGISKVKSAGLVVVFWAVLTMLGALPGWLGSAVMSSAGG